MTRLRRIVWLASYPKSGNTWTRIFLSHYLESAGSKTDLNRLGRLTTGDSSQARFDKVAGGPFRAESVDHWLSMRLKALRYLVETEKGIRYVKTHCKARMFRGQPLIPPELTAAAVYIIRNPFDVVPSFSRHMGVDLDTAISKMCDSNHRLGTETGILDPTGRWDEHVASWTTAPGLSRHVMRYEDMTADPETAFRGLLEFLEIPVEFGRLRRAIRRTSFDNLKKREREKGFKERPQHMQAFFARGRPGGWREELSPAQVARVRAEFLPTIEKWYPEMLEETAAVAEAAQ